jgi:hypothetical protein
MNLKALTGQLHWYRVADILGFLPADPAAVARAVEAHGYDGLLDLRRSRYSLTV